MRRKAFGISLIIGAISLAGCTTPEVRTEPVPKDTLSFYSDANKQEEASAQAPSGSKPPQSAPINPSDNNVTDKKMYTTPPKMTIDQTKEYIATLATDAGDIVVELAAKETPITVNNFVFLAREKFYDGTVFHRTIEGFMIQGGDPEGTGMGGPGYKFADEPFTGKYTRGTLAMANSGPDTNGSQFFIMHKESPLPPDYVIFGHVSSGLEVVDKIAEAKTLPGGEGSSPVTPVRIRNVRIVEK